MKNHYINIPFNGSTAKHTIFNIFNYEFNSNEYLNLNDDGIPNIYNSVYKYVQSLKKDERPIVFSPDYSISSATCTAIAEKYVEKTEINKIVKFNSPVKILYFTPVSHYDELTNISALDFSKSILSNIFDENILSYTKHDFIISPENFILVGLRDDKEDAGIAKLKEKNIKYLTLSNITNDVNKTANYLFNELENSPVYVIYDMSVLSFESSPATFRFNATPENSNGLETNDMIKIFDKLKKLDIVGLDITGFNLKTRTNDISFKITTDAAKIPLVHLLSVVEKKINIFNENTKILICKPISEKKRQIVEKKYLLKQIISDSDIDSDEEVEEEPDTTDDEYGWYIMRGVSTDLKEQLIQKLINVKNNILIYRFGEESMYISFTTIDEQSTKSYAVASSIEEKVLVPGEKVNLMFSQL